MPSVPRPPPKIPDISHRGAIPGLVFKTREDARPTAAGLRTVTPPVIAPNEKQVWWQWTQEHVAHARSEIKKDHDFDTKCLHEAIGTVIGMKCREVREDLEREINFLKRELEQTQSKIDVQAELEREREALRAKAAEVDRAELESLRREITLLRKELGVDRSLHDLRSEVVEAQKQIPKLPAVVSQLRTETAIARSNADNKIAALERELTATKERLSKARVEQSITSYSLAKLERARAKPGIELKFETQKSSFSIRDMHPDAAAAWKRFVAGVLESPQDETATMLLIDPAGTA
jgi:hypothetical protein